MSKQKKQQEVKERYVKGTYERVSSAWWIISVGFAVLWGIFLLFDIMESRKVSLYVLTLIFTDVQLGTAVASIFGITFGWAILESAAERIIYYYQRHRGKHIPDRVQTLITFTSIFWLALLFTCNYLTIFDFNDYGLYIIVGIIYALVLIIYFKTSLEIKLIKMKKWKKIVFSDDQSHFYIPYEKIFVWFIIAGFFIVFLYYYNFGNQIGVTWAKSLGDLFLQQIQYNLIVIVLFIVALTFTIFFPFVDALGVALLVGCYRIITTSTRDKIHSVRKYTALFVLLTIMWKILDVFGISFIDPSIEVLLGLVVMVIIGIIKGRIQKSLAI